MKTKLTTIFAALALAISATMFTGCASIKSSLADETTVTNVSAILKSASTAGTSIALSQFYSDSEKQERIAKIMVIVSSAIVVVANSEDATPANLEAAISKALVGEDASYVIAVNSGLEGVIALYKTYYASAISEKLSTNTTLAALRKFLIAIASGVNAAALPYSALSN